MATKLKKLQINEVSLCDVGANQHSHIVLFKRHVPAEIELPEPTLQEIDGHFDATGRGPMHDRLFALYDDYRRQSNFHDSAFRQAWADLSADERQQIRDEENAHAAAVQAAADAERKGKQSQMSDEGLMVKAAHAVASGTLENRVRKSTWHGALRKMAAERQKPAESIAQAVARLIQTDPDAKVLLKAELTGVADEASAPVATAPVIKAGSAYARLHDIGAGLRATDPSLTREQAFAKAYASNPELAARTKVERAFA